MSVFEKLKVELDCINLQRIASPEIPFCWPLLLYCCCHELDFSLGGNKLSYMNKFETFDPLVFLHILAIVYLCCMGTPPCFSVIFTKGNNFHGHLLLP